MWYTYIARERKIMKKFYNYTFQLVCIYILVLSLFSIFCFDITNTKYDKNGKLLNNVTSGGIYYVAGKAAEGLVK